MLDRSRKIEADVRLPFFNRGDNLEIEEEEKNDVDHPGLGHNMGYDAPFKGELGLNPFHQGNETPRSSIKRPESGGVNDWMATIILETDSSTERSASEPPMSVATQPGLMETASRFVDPKDRWRRTVSIFRAALLIE